MKNSSQWRNCSTLQYLHTRSTRVVIRTRQHLAALVPQGAFIVLQTLRYAAEILPDADVARLATTLKAAGATAREQKMAEQLVEDMSAFWKPEQY